MESRLITAQSLSDLVSRSSAIVVGVVEGETGTRTAASGMFEDTFQIYAVQPTEVVMGSVAGRFTVPLLRSSRLRDDPREAKWQHYRPLAVGGTYVFFLGPQQPTGEWVPGPEPWRFRVTDDVRPESPWSHAVELFPVSSLADFLGEIKSLPRSR